MGEEQEQKFHQLTEEPVSRVISHLAVPCIISMLVTAFYNMADTFFVGMLRSNAATGAVGVVFSMMAVIQAVGFFFGHGSGNFISRELGRRNTDSASNMAATGFFSALFTGLLICVFGEIFLTPLAAFLGSSPTILPYAKDYLRVILIGAPWMTASLVLNNQLRFQGNAIYGTIGIASGAVLNIGLDPLLIFVFYAFTSQAGGFTLENFSTMAQYTGVFGRSFLLAIIATFICLLIGYPLSYWLAQESPAVRRVAMMLIMLPMWMNFLLRTYSWMFLLEKRGLINSFLGLFGIGPFQMINTQGAVVLGMVYNFLPFMILPILSVLEKIDPKVIEAAQDLGANSFTVFRRVTFPLSLPGVLSGVTMVFIPSVSTFVISRLLGGGKSLLLGDLIEMQFMGTTYNPWLGSAIALVMMVIVLVCMAIMNRFGEGEEGVSFL